MPIIHSMRRCFQYILLLCFLVFSSLLSAQTVLVRYDTVCYGAVGVVGNQYDTVCSFNFNDDAQGWTYDGYWSVAETESEACHINLNSENASRIDPIKSTQYPILRAYSEKSFVCSNYTSWRNSSISSIVSPAINIESPVTTPFTVSFYVSIIGFHHSGYGDGCNILTLYVGTSPSGPWTKIWGRGEESESWTRYSVSLSDKISQPGTYYFRFENKGVGYCSAVDNFVITADTRKEIPEDVTSAEAYTEVVTEAVAVDVTTTTYWYIAPLGDEHDTINGCDSILYEGNYYYDSVALPTTGLRTTHGCDSTYTVHLLIDNSVKTTVDTAVCDTIRWIYGAVYTHDTVVTDTLKRYNGDGSGGGPILLGATLVQKKACDSVVTIRLKVHNSFHTSIFDTISHLNLPYTAFNGSQYDYELQNELVHYSTEYGCDSNFYLNLAILTHTFYSVYDTVCQGSTGQRGNQYEPIVSYTFDDGAQGWTYDGYWDVARNESYQAYTNFGSYSPMIDAWSGSSFFCSNFTSNSQSYTFPSNTSNLISPAIAINYDPSVYPVTLKFYARINGFSSSLGGTYINTLKLYVSTSPSGPWSELWHGGGGNGYGVWHEYTVSLSNYIHQPGTYYFRFENTGAGYCSAIDNFRITADTRRTIPADALYSSDTTIAEERVFINKVFDTITDNVYWYIAHHAHIFDTIEGCDSVFFYDRYYYGSETLYLSDNTEYGCDSTVTLRLNVKKSSVENIERNVCDQFTWHDSTYTSTPDAALVDKTTNNAGCDSTVTLHLTISKRTSGVVYMEKCDHYTLNGRTYTSTPNDVIKYLYIDGNEAGCDSVISFYLTIYHSSDTSLFDTISHHDLPYTAFNGQQYTHDFENKLFKLKTVHNCDSNVYLNLAVLYSTEEADGNLHFPYIVTPNDDGVNDIFKVIGAGKYCSSRNHLTIYNSQGVVVFRLDNIQSETQGWDPRNFPAGTYFFQFTADAVPRNIDRRGVVQVSK